jgi:acyl-CoA thioesterase-1
MKTALRVSLCGYLAVAAASCGSTSSPAAPSSGSTPTPATSATIAPQRVVVLGDSLSVSPTASESFPAVLQQRLLSRAPGSTMKNAGVYGDTTGEGLSRFDADVSPGTTILILELGANDGLGGTDLGEIERNLSATIERARARGMKVLLCGMETPPFHGFQYTVDFHAIYPRLAAKYGISLVPFLLDGVLLNPAYNLSDGIHPNAAGAQRVADTVWPYLDSMLASAVT